MDDDEKILITGKIEEKSVKKEEPKEEAKPSENEILSQMELETEDGIDGSILEETLGLDIALPGIPVSEAVFEEQKKR